MWRETGLLVVLSLAGLVSGLYDSSDDVVELTDSNFANRVTNSDSIWVVEFYAPWCGHCQQLSPEYKKAARALKGTVYVGAVDCDNHKSVCGQFGIRGFPTIKIFGGNKASPQDYNGQRTASGILDAALSEAKNEAQRKLKGGGSSSGGKSSGGSSGGGSDAVIELTDSNFDDTVINSMDMWIVEFMAPWCGHCKNLAPHYAKAAKELDGKVKFGVVDATVHTSRAQQYNVQGYPTILYFPAGTKEPASAQQYDGGRTSSDIVEWALARYADNVPAPEIFEVTGPSVYSECTEKPLCVLAFLPHILDCDSTCRNTYIQLLQDLGNKYKSKLWGWVWAEAGAQYELEQSLDIGGFGYPAMAVLSQKKKIFSVLRGAFTNEGISAYLRDISYGKGPTSKLKAEPKVSKTEPWDGKDGELPTEDDDLDLSDVNLDEKDEL